MNTEVQRAPRNGAGALPPETHPVDAATLEKVIVGGDCSKLSPAERLQWYKARCDAAGLDVRTQPFLYVTLQNRLQLYATKSATDQLIANRRLTVQIVDRKYVEEFGVYEVHCVVTFPDGQRVEDFAAVATYNLHGESLCNALMKCVTKAKRRTVLSACGLGMQDESDIEDGVMRASVPPALPSPDRPRHVEPRVWGQPEDEDGVDGRPYHRLAADAAAELARRLREAGLGDCPFGPKEVHAFLINAAVQQGLCGPPKDRKALSVLGALNDVYRAHRDWLRGRLNEYLEGLFEQARAARAEVPEAAPAPDPDDYNGGETREREPGED